MTLTAVGGHFTMSETRESPPPWSLTLVDKEGHGWTGEWVGLGGNGGTSGAMAASVPRHWIEGMCTVKGIM